jgi:outer membrane immunogenic protein
MYRLILIAILLAAVGSAFGQSPLATGQNQFNAGVGFSNWGVPVYIGFDHQVSNAVSLGAEFSYKSYNERHHDHRYDHSIVGISGNVNYHFNTVLNIPRNWDFYAGLNVGYYYWNSPNDYDGDYHSGLGLGGQIGGRYYFTDSFGLNLEFGGGNAFNGGKLGISLKL